jgi:hypothetical protein
MNHNPTTKKNKELLDKLQQESWQLELLISGFAIFGLIASIDPIGNKLNELIALETPYFKGPLRIAILCCYVLIMNLVLHVVLRGLWIGAIGLRYVSDEIDYEALNYGKRFTNYLEKKVGSFDDYIAKLENYCSVLFAVAFLSLFYIIAFFTVFLIIALIGYFFMQSGFFSEMIGAGLLAVFGITYLLLALIVFIDFITLGYFKKKERSSFLYMPIYKLFSFITLSFLYRPLVYNFLDNKFGRRILALLTPFYIILFYLSTSINVRSNFLQPQTYSTSYYTSNKNYLNLLEENQYIRTAAIDSKIISKPYLKVFIPLKGKLEDKLILLDSTLKPKKDKRGFNNSAVKINFKHVNRKKIMQKKDSISSLFFNTINKMYVIKIDSLDYSTDFLGTEINKQLGFETILPIKSITEGKHKLSISNYIVDKKTKETNLEKVIDIPFWYYKN